MCGWNIVVLKVATDKIGNNNHTIRILIILEEEEVTGSCCFLRQKIEGGNKKQCTDVDEEKAQ